MSNEINIIKKEGQPIVALAHNLEVKDVATMKAATDVLSKLNKMSDKITEEKEKVTKPLNEALKAERARWKPIEELYEGAIGVVRGKMSAYQTQKIKEEREEEARIAARVGEGKGKLKIETAVKKIGSMERVEGKMVGEEGMVKFREEKKFEVMDVTMLPKEYIVADEIAIRKAMKNGVELPGVKYWVESVPINFR